MSGRCRLILAFIGISLISFMISYVIFDSKVFDDFRLPSKHVPDNAVTKTEQQGPDKTEAETENEDNNGEEIYIITQVKYKRCNHVQDLDRTLVDVYGFRVPEDFLLLYSDFEMDSISDTGIVLVKHVDGLCPDKSRHVHIGICNGRVGLYMGPPQAGILIEEMGIFIKNLPRTEIEALARGIETGSRQELLEILEGLSSLTPF